MMTSIKRVLHMKTSEIFTFIDDTYQELRRFNTNLQNNLKGAQLMQTINKYKNGCNEVFSKALEAYDMAHKLAQNIIRTIDIFKGLCSCISDLEEYNYRICEIMSIFIACELRLSVDATREEQILITHRIIYIMRRHLLQDEEQETLYNILRTLVYIPKLFNARDIMCAIFGEFIPIKPVLEVKVLPDKLYILYMIVFYRWMMMQKENDDKILIVNFAQRFMKPCVSLCSNNLYAPYLPMYTRHSTATCTILNDLKFYREILNASVADNAFKHIRAVVNLCDDDEEDCIIENNSPTGDFAEIFNSARLEAFSGTMLNIKFEEETVVSTVDLTEEEDPVLQTSIWLNQFQTQYPELPFLFRRQQNIQMISNGEKETIICLDSDSEEEPEISTDNNATPVAATANQQNNSEDLLFVDNYPLADTPINFVSGLPEYEVTLGTYHSKNFIQSETENKNNSDATQFRKLHHMDEAYIRKSVHISSTSPESTHNEDNDGADAEDKHDDDGGEETNTYLLAPNKRREQEILAKAILPMRPYTTYNNINTAKGVFAHSDISDISKSPIKQIQKVSSYNCKPREHSSHTHIYKAFDVPQYHHLQGTKEKLNITITYLGKKNKLKKLRLGNDISLTKFKSKLIRKQQLDTIIKHNLNDKNNNSNNNCSNLKAEPHQLKTNLLQNNDDMSPTEYHHLQGTKEKLNKIITYLGKKNKLKQLWLGNDISLTKFKSKLIRKQQPHTKPHTIIKHNLNNKNNNCSNIQTELRQLKTNLLQNDDDFIFKKPLPVKKKKF